MSSIGAIEKFLSEYVSNMMTTLLLIPDNPEQGVLYLLTGIVNLVQKHFQWENIEIKFNILSEILVTFNCLKQESFIYHLENGKKNFFLIFYSFNI